MPTPSIFDGVSKLLTLSERQEWSAYLKKLPRSMQDVYYTPEYYEIYQKNLNGKAVCFVFEHNERFALYPFLIDQINNLDYNLNDTYYDIRGAYGYNGPIYSSDDIDFKCLFYRHFDEFIHRSNIIAEFTRFNPLLENHKFSNGYLSVIYDRQIVYVDLTKPYSEIFASYSRNAKQNINRALTSGLSVKSYQFEFPYKKAFVNIYKETMSRVKASSFLYFNDSYFNNTFKDLSPIQFVVFKADIPIASALCLKSSEFIHMHFTGSYKEFLNCRPNDLLFDKVIEYGIKSGFKKLLLGGGHTPQEDDSLLRFKRNFSKLTGSFYIGKKIYNKEVYHTLVSQWQAKYPYLFDKYGSRVLSYRYFT